MIKETDDTKEKIKYANLMAVRALSSNMHNHFDSLFNKIFVS